MPLVIALYQERLSFSKTLLRPLQPGRAALVSVFAKAELRRALVAVESWRPSRATRMDGIGCSLYGGLVVITSRPLFSFLFPFFFRILLRFYNADRDGPNGPKAVVNRAGFGFEAPCPITEGDYVRFF